MRSRSSMEGSPRIQAPPEPVESANPRSERDRRILLGLAERIDAADAGAHNNLGVLYYNKGMLAEAVDQFERALEIDSGMRLAQRNLEVAYFATGYYDRLIAELAERITRDAADAGARRRLAQAYLRTGAHEAALRELARLRVDAPDDPQILLLQAQAQKEVGEFDAALGTLRRAQTVDPSSAVLRFHLGELYYRRGLNKEARDELERAVELLPDFADAHYLLAFVLGDLGDEGGAAAAAARAREMNPALTRVETNLSLDRYSPARFGELVGEREARPRPTSGYLARYHLGVALRQQGLFGDALRELERALSAGEDPLLVRQAMAEARLVQGEIEEAERLYRGLLEENDGSPKLWNELGVTLHRRGDIAGARGCYEAALERDPDYAVAWNNVGVARLHGGDPDGLGDALARALEHHPAFADAWCNLGLHAEQVGRFHEALRAFRNAAENEPRSAAAWVGIGRVLAEGGELAEARNALARAVESDPDSVEARYHLGFALSRLGQYDAALLETRRALELSPYFPAPRYRLAIDLQFEYAEVLAPELDAAAPVPSGEHIASFTFDSEELEPLFREMRPRGRAAGERAGDPFKLARDFISKGLLARASAEIRRGLQLGGGGAEAALLSGEIFLRQQLEGEALERFEAALAALGAEPWSERHLQAHLGRARALLRLGRTTEARAVALTIETRTGDHPDVLRIRGEASMLEDVPEAAVAAFARLLELQPGDPLALRALGSAARASGSMARAEEALRGAMDIDPEYVSARIELAELLLEGGRLVESASLCEQALEILPGYLDALVLLARVERARANYDRATDLLVETLLADAYHFPALCLLGSVLRDTGRYSESRRSLRRLLRIAPQQAEARLELGRTAAAEGHVREALSHWGAVVESGARPDLVETAEREMAELQALTEAGLGAPTRVLV